MLVHIAWGWWLYAAELWPPAPWFPRLVMVALNMLLVIHTGVNFIWFGQIVRHIRRNWGSSGTRREGWSMAAGEEVVDAEAREGGRETTILRRRKPRR